MVVSAGGLTDVRVDLSHFEPEFQVLHEGLLRELVQQNKVRLPILGRAEGGHASLLRLKVPGGEVEGAAHAQVKAPSRTPPAASSVELPEARSDCLSSLARRNTSEFRPTPCSRTRFDSRNLHCACAITLPQLRMPVSACVYKTIRVHVGCKSRGFATVPRHSATWKRPRVHRQRLLQKRGATRVQKVLT